MKRFIHTTFLLMMLMISLAFTAQAATESNKTLTQAETLAVKRLNKLKATKQSTANLKKAFRWAASLKYYNNTQNGLKGKKAAEYYGVYGFKTGKGDCNTMAYTFYWMAKMLGYDATAVQGYVKSGSGLSSHAWVTIKMGKKTYVFDPDFSHEYAGKTVTAANGKSVKLGKYCGFKITYAQDPKHPHLQYYNAKKKALAK